MTSSLADDDLLRRTQIVLTRILEEFDRVCRELDIPYVVYGGTAIGAVRHRGFIPWDDDIDVALLRADYQRFLAEAPAVLDPRFRLDNVDTQADFPFMFTKMVLKDTLLIPEAAKDSAYRMPAFVDILPLDPLPDDPRAQRRQIARTWFWGRLLFLQGTGKPFVSFDGLLKNVVYAGTGLIHKSLNLARVSPKKLQRQWERAAREYEGTKTARFADFTMQDPRPWSASVEELYPAVDAPFEDLTVKLAGSYDALLRRGYGDYMQLPPEDQRGGHKPYRIDLGRYDPHPDAPRGQSPSPGDEERAGSSYQPGELQRLQALLLMALAEFDRVCREIGVGYAVYAGTAIGAVRHEGFIPWDDDVDVCMVRADYQRFLAEAPGLLGDRYRLDSLQSDPDYPNTFANLSLVGTEFISEAAKDREYRMPIGIDIFPLDKVAPRKADFDWQRIQTALLGRLLFLHGCPRPYLSLPAPARKAALVATMAVHDVMKLTGVTTSKLQHKWERAARRYEDSDSTVYADFAMADPRHWSMSSQELFPLVDHKFEGLKVTLPHDYDTLLRRGYGDYMTLPDPSQRVNHRPFYIDFGPYADELAE